MIQSMTGFGKTEVALENLRYTIEIKSLNSKNLDLNVRLPSELKHKELEIRKCLAEHLNRGKIDVYINYEANTTAKTYQINTELVKQYMEQFRLISAELPEAVLFESAMKMPEVLNSETEGISETDWQIFVEGLNQAIQKANEFRTDEGKILAQDFELRVQRILELLLEVPQYEQERIVSIKERLQKALKEINDADQNRFEQELIFYLEKLDVTEEKVRLKNHCEYFFKTMESPESNGKKLNFICQEMGREINTLGSKSNHAEMQKLVIKMKDELEKIKEQVLNVL